MYEIPTNLRKVLQYFTHLKIEEETTKFDSRVVFRIVRPGYRKTHEEWIAFIKNAKTQPTFRGVIIQLSPHQEEFAMLTANQASILICFDGNDIRPDLPISRMLKYLLACLEYYRAIDGANRFLFDSIFSTFALDQCKNKTLEETVRPKEDTPLKKEKRLEREFGEKLTAQGISVQYQVSCKHGIADIVTPDAIYEVKASLSRSTLHKAISQVLLYRNCLNPSAKAIVIGYPYRKQAVDIEMAKSLGVEVIICEDEKAK